MDEDIEECDDVIEIEDPKEKKTEEIRKPTSNWLENIQITKKNPNATFNIFNDILKKSKLGYLGSKLQRSLSRIQIEGNSNKSKEVLKKSKF